MVISKMIERVKLLEEAVEALTNALDATLQTLKAAQVHDQQTLVLVGELQRRLVRLENLEVPSYMRLACAYCREVCESLTALQHHIEEKHPGQPVAGGTPGAVS